ncbi:MAG: rRNA maturation RNase YbeY [Planctomycetes bacterium RIFCSPHIGHO2_12_42_15]|nr:MAG: rRNA maturation RNase YbeY [Planctomycetes bacterium RIFCSPHIGHO2_12_42_15]
MKLEIINLQKLYPVDTKSIKKIARGVLKFEKQDAELNIVFTDNKRIKEINKTFLGHNYATDVITFAYDEASINNDKASGEIIISVEMAKKLAQKHDCAVEGEIALYLVHGLLHLFGYNDKQRKEAKKMHQREGELLSSLGFRVPVPH